MPTPSLGNKRLPPFGTDVEKLFNGRYRVTRRWQITDENTVPSKQELDLNYFEEFSTEDLTPFGDDPADIPEGYRFDDCVLVRQYTTFPAGLGFQIFVKEYETVTDVFEDTEPASKSVTANGLSVYSQPQIGSLTAPFTGVIGVTTKVFDGVTHTLASFREVESGPAFKRIELQWAQPGVLDAETNFAKDGILYVTFISQGTRIRPTALAAGKTLTDDPNEAFIGGAEAPLFRNRIRNVNGFRQYVTTVMLKHDGSKLESGQTVKSLTQWVPMRFPGVVDTTFNEGFLPQPGSTVKVRAVVSEVMTTSNDVGATPVPFYIKRGAWVNVRWTPTATGIAQSANRAFGENFLAGSIGLAGSNTTFLGEPVTAIAGGGGSDPTYAEFLALNEPVLSRELLEDMTTDEGVQWYRIRQVKLVGTFGGYLT